MAQPISAEPNQPYGQAGAQREAQRSMPLPSMTPLSAPSQRPSEPVTAGLPVGAGPGPDVLTAPPGQAESDERLRLLAPQLARLASLPGVHPDVKSLARRVRAAAKTRR